MWKGKKNTDNIENAAANKKMWLRAFAFYAVVEALFNAVSYAVEYAYCKVCVLPVTFYCCRFIVSILLTAMVWYALSAIHHLPKLKIAVGNILVFLLYYFIYTGLLYAAINSKHDFLVWPSVKTKTYGWVVYGSWYDIGKYFLLVTAFYVLKFYFEYRRSAQQRLQLAVINKDMQLNLLKQQLSPHFYFNTLNNLYGLARSNNIQLTTALHQLSSIMRYVITDCNQPKVLLTHEINFLRSYIELEKLRYEKNTVIEMYTEGDVKQQTIIPLLLIQFVENAFKHGMKEKLEDNWMKVTLSITGNVLLFEVANSYYGAAPSNGIGLSSVQRILNLQYEGRHTMQLHYNAGSFLVTLKLNLS